MESQPEQPERPRLHRSHKERLVFGVSGGLAEYVGVDPTVVRLAFVAVALIPPASALSLVGYPLLAIVMPEEGTEHLPPRDALRGNVAALRTEVEAMADKVSAGVASVTQGRRPAAGAAIPTADPAVAEGDASPATAEVRLTTEASAPAGTRE